MSTVLIVCVLLLLLGMGIALVHAARVRPLIDRIAAAQLVGSISIATLMLLAELGDEPALQLVALLLALLGAVTVVALLRAGVHFDRED